MDPITFLGAGFGLYWLAKEWLRESPPEQPSLAMPKKNYLRAPVPLSWPLFEPIRGALKTDQLCAQEFLDDQLSLLDNLSFDFCGLFWPLKSLNKQMLVSGLPGSGKNVVKRKQLISLVKLMENPMVSRLKVVVLDPISQDLPFLYQITPPDIEIISASPSYADGSAWNVADDITNLRAVNAFVHSLLPDSLGSQNSDPFWPRMSREVTKGVLRVFLEKKSAWSLASLVKCFEHSQFLAAILEQSAQTQGLLKDLQNESGADVLKTVRSHILPMSIAAAYYEHAKHKFSLKEFLNKDKAILHLGFIPKDMSAMSGVAAAMIQFLVDEKIQGTPNEYDYLHFVCDEVDSLSSIRGLVVASAQGRNFGLGSTLYFQSIDGLIDSWGKNSVSKLISLSHAWCCLQADATTAVEFARLSDKIEGLACSFGKNWGSNNTVNHGWNSSYDRHGNLLSSGPSSGYSSGSSYGENKNYQLLTKEALLPSEVIQLREASDQDDFAEAFLFSHKLQGFVHTRFSFMEQFRSLDLPAFTDILHRPDSQEVLPPFDEEELALQLKIDITASIRTALQQTKIP